MIFDLVLIIMVIHALSKASAKGCTDDLNFTVFFLVIVRIAGIFYMPVSRILSKFIDQSYAVYAAYLVMAVITFFIFNTIIGQRIIETGKKIPKTTGRMLTYIFAVFKTVIIYSVIFTILYTIPVLHKLPDRLITPVSYNLTYGILGTGTEEVFKEITIYFAETLNNPVEYFEKQKQKQASGATKQLDAVKSHEDLKDFLDEDKKKAKKK